MNSSSKDSSFDYSDHLLSCGLTIQYAQTAKLRKERLRLITQLYIENHYITNSDLNEEGLFIDSYEDRGLPFVVLDEGMIVGSLRLIFGSLIRLPISRLLLNQTALDLRLFKWCELTQIGISRDYRGDAKGRRQQHLFRDLVLYSAGTAYLQRAPVLGAVVNVSLYTHASQLLQTPIKVAGPNQKLDYPPYCDSELLTPLMAKTEDFLPLLSFT